MLLAHMQIQWAFGVVTCEVSADDQQLLVKAQWAEAVSRSLSFLSTSETSHSMGMYGARIELG